MYATSEQDGSFTWVNGAWEEVLGWTLKELTRDGFLVYVHPHDHERTLTAFRELINGGQPVHGLRNRWRTKTETWVWLEWDAHLLPSGAVYGIAHATLPPAPDEHVMPASPPPPLDDEATDPAMLSPEQRLARITHDLRNHISAIDGAVMMARRASRPGDWLDAIQETTADVEELLNELALGEQEREEVQFNPHQIAKNVVLLARPRTPNIRLEHEIALTTPRLVSGWPRQIRQILTNLVLNAQRHAQASTITISLESTEVGGQLWLHYSVTDDGRGIPPHLREDIFRPHVSSAGRRPDRGLGLTNARYMAEGLGGRLELQPQTHQTSFTLSLPTTALEQVRPNIAGTGLKLAGGLFNAKSKFTDKSDARQTKGHHTEAASPTPAAGTASHRVLLVEDHPINLLVCQGMLHAIGCQVGTATTLSEAERLLTNESWDLLLIDLQLPDGHGTDFVQTVRDRESQWGLPALRIVGVSAETSEPVVRKCLEVGMDCVISKPLDPRDIEDLIPRER